MSRSKFRHVATALNGLILLAQFHPESAIAQHQTSQSQTPRNTLQLSLEIPGGLSDADQEKKPCDKGDDNRKSDLCAQWKAADAAAESAYWTQVSSWIGCFGAAVGFLTLVAASAAAYYAREAARHTEMGAEQARKSNEVAQQALIADNRAWVSIGIAPIRSARYGGGRIGFLAKVTFKNVGKGPAVDICPSFECGFLKKDYDVLRKHTATVAKVEWYGSEVGSFALTPNEEFTIELWQEADEWPKDARNPLEWGVFFSAVAAYTNQMMQGPRVSIRTWEVSLMGGPLDSLLNEQDDSIDAELVDQAGAAIIT